MHRHAPGLMVPGQRRSSLRRFERSCGQPSPWVRCASTVISPVLRAPRVRMPHAKTVPGRWASRRPQSPFLDRCTWTDETAGPASARDREIHAELSSANQTSNGMGVLAGSQTKRQTQHLSERHAGGQTERLSERHAGGQTVHLSERQTERQIGAPSASWCWLRPRRRKRGGCGR